MKEIYHQFKKPLSHLLLMIWFCTMIAGCGVNNIPSFDEQAKAA